MDIHLLLDTKNEVTVRTSIKELSDTLVENGCILLGTIHGYNAGFNSAPGSKYKSITGRQWKHLYLKDCDEDIQN